MVYIKRPILVAVIGYIIGIIMGLYFNLSIVPFYILIIAIYVSYKIASKKQKKKFKLISFRRYFRYIKLFLNQKTILFIIVISILSNTQILIQNNKYSTVYKEGTMSVEAIVVSNKEEKEYKNRYKIKVCSKNQYKNTYLYLKTDKETYLNYGDKIKATCEFVKPERARNYGGFDYSKYLKTLKIHGELKASTIDVIDSNKANYVLTLANRVKLKIEQQINLKLEASKAELVKGILLGETSGIEEELKENFKNANISHILAVSRFACFIYCNGDKLNFGETGREGRS